MSGNQAWIRRYTYCNTFIPNCKTLQSFTTFFFFHSYRNLLVNSLFTLPLSVFAIFVTGQCSPFNIKITCISAGFKFFPRPLWQTLIHNQPQLIVFHASVTPSIASVRLKASKYSTCSNLSASQLRIIIFTLLLLHFWEIVFLGNDCAIFILLVFVFLRNCLSEKLSRQQHST